VDTYSSEEGKALRGGSFYSPAEDAQVRFRGDDLPSYAYFTYGIRLVICASEAAGPAQPFSKPAAQER